MDGSKSQQDKLAMNFRELQWHTTLLIIKTQGLKGVLNSCKLFENYHDIPKLLNNKP
jgi:hypothetical protein